MQSLTLSQALLQYGGFCTEQIFETGEKTFCAILKLTQLQSNVQQLKWC